MKSLLGTALALAVLSLSGCASLEGSETQVAAREKPQYDEPLTGSRCARSPPMILRLAPDIVSIRFKALRPTTNQMIKAPVPMTPSAIISA